MGELRQFVEHFGREWAVIQQAWVTFTLAAVLMAGVIAICARKVYAVRIANLESDKQSLHRTIDELKGRIETRDETIQALQSRQSVQPRPPEAKSPIPPVNVAIEETLRSYLTGKRWEFHYNVRNNEGKKPLTFLPDGSIGEGRNGNEFRWEVDGDLLIIIRQNGDIQNVFRRDPSGRLLFVDDGRAKGFRDQFLEPLR